MVGGAANALSLCPDNTKIVVAGRSLLKIFTIDENAMEFIDFKNLHAGRRQVGKSLLNCYLVNLCVDCYARSKIMSFNL